MPFIKTPIAKLHYQEYGTGSKVMLAFHGFGMKGTQFGLMEPYLGKHYKMYSFDLFFHGDTVLHNGSLPQIREGITSAVFAELIVAFIKEKGLEQQPLTLLSYSIGARFALALLQELPQMISGVYFIAPDGIEPNKLLVSAAENRLINRSFWRLVSSPKTVNFLLRVLRKTRYIDDSLERILSREFETHESRLACYNTITYLRKLSFDRERLAALMNDHAIEIRMYFGQHDKLFPPSIGERFKNLVPNAYLHIFDEGHELVNAELCKVMEEELENLMSLNYDQR